jgi:hypothetical protein
VNYSYIKSRPLNDNEKRNLYISVATQLHLTNPNLESSQNRRVNSLLSFLSSPNTKINRNWVNWLLSYGKPRLIQELISSLSRTADTNQIVLDTIKNANPRHLLSKEYILPDIQRIQIKPHPKTALVCFMGNALKLNIPVQLFHILVADRFDLIIYLRDPEKQCFTSGIHGFSQNQVELNIVLRREIPTDCHIAVLGTSSGGYAAAKFAEDVQANRLAMFSPPLLFKNVTAINSPTKMHLDNVRLYFGCKNKMDLKLASEWSNTDYSPSIRWFNTKSHGTLEHLFQHGQINSLFEWLIAGKEIPCMPLRKLLLVRFFMALSYFKHAVFKRSL